MAETEAVARDVVAIHGEAHEIINELLKLREQYGLDVEVPPVPKPDFAESKAAGITGSLLGSVGYSLVIDRQLDAELASARQQAELETA